MLIRPCITIAIEENTMTCSRPFLKIGNKQETKITHNHGWGVVWGIFVARERDSSTHQLQAWHTCPFCSSCFGSRQPHATGHRTIFLLLGSKKGTQQIRNDAKPLMGEYYCTFAAQDSSATVEIKQLVRIIFCNCIGFDLYTSFDTKQVLLHFWLVYVTP